MNFFHRLTKKNGNSILKWNRIIDPLSPTYLDFIELHVGDRFREIRNQIFH